MSAILAAIGWIITSLGGWLIAFFTRKIAVATAVLASFVFITAAFIVCIKTMVLYVLTLAVIPAWIVNSLAMFVPFNFFVILSNILGAQSCRYAYDKAMDKIRIINSAS